MSSVQLKSLDDGNVTDVPVSGVTVVGRGPFLEITDKRVSRNHANLEIVDGKLYLTPIHVNPCFFKKGGEGSQKILEKDDKFCLEEGDVFGLLPDQLFFKVLYKDKPVNGDVKNEPESVPSQTNGDTKSDTKDKVDPDKGWDKSSDNEKEKEKNEIKVETKSEVKSENNNDKESSSPSAGPSTVTPPGQKEMALPLERKRQLPAWLIQAAKTGPSPEKKKPAPKVPAPSKRAPRAATSKPIPEAFLTDGEDDEVIPVKKSRSRPSPRKPLPKDSFSEGESEEEPAPKPKNRSKTLIPGTRTPRRKDQYNSDDDSDEPIGRRAKPIPRRTARPPTPESFTPSKRPVRAAKYARGSYEDEVSDEYDEFGASQKKYEDDSDFIMEDDDSGSDWGSKKSKGKGKGKAVAAKNTPKPRSTARGSRSRGRSRKSRSDVDSDEYLDEYVPRPSKRRASKAAKSDSELEDSPPPKPRETKMKKKKKADSEDEKEDDDGKPKKRKPCEFGKKCYRKNPVHLKETCHPGDKSYDEAEEEEEEDDKAECPYGTSCFRTNTAHKEQYSHNNKPSKDINRSKRENAGKKSVLEGDEDDDGDRNTYDYNDSFIDNNEGEESEESFFDPAEEDSDYDPESEDVAGLVKDAKGFQKNKKLVKPARSR